MLSIATQPHLFITLTYARMDRSRTYSFGALSLLVVALIAIGAMKFLGGSPERGSTARSTATTAPGEAAHTYASNTHGISFQYPSDYYLKETDEANVERSRHRITLIPNTPENRALIEGTYQGAPRELPPTISIDVFTNYPSTQTTESWIRGSRDSNYKQSQNETLTNVTVGGEVAIAYRWTGLYEGETTAIARSTSVYAFSVTYFSPEDKLIQDYRAVLQTVKFI